MDSPRINQTVCKVLNRFQHGKYLVAYVLNKTMFDLTLTVVHLCILDTPKWVLLQTAKTQVERCILQHAAFH